MPTALLSGTTPAYLPARPITLIVERQGSGPAVDIHVHPDTGVRRPRPGMVIVPAVSERVSVAVRPVAGGAFPTPTVVHLSAVVTDPSAGDHDRVMVPSVSVAGLPVVELMLLEPAGSYVAIRRPEGNTSPSLSEVGDAASLAARGRLAASRLPDKDQVDVRIVVDASASMAEAVADGSLAFAIDLLTGVSAVIGTHSTQDTVVMSAPLRPVQAEARQLADAVTQVVSSHALGNGFLAAPALGLAQGRSCTYLVTDSIPVDQDRLDDSCHVVALVDQSCTNALRAMCRLRFSIIDIGQLTTGSATVRQHAIEQCVASLLAPIEGSTL